MDLQKERELIQRAKKNPVEFGQLFYIYYPQIFGYVLRRVADPSTAQDIVAETFLKAYQNLGRFKWRDVSIGNWFYKIATNELRVYFRKSKYAPRSLELLFETDGFEPISDQDLHQEMVDAQTAIERQEQFVAAQKILATLPIKYQEVISLRFVEKKKLSEIALILDKKEGTVKSLVSRALAKLREKLVPLETQPNETTSINTFESQLLIQSQGSYEE